MNRTQLFLFLFPFLFAPAKGPKSLDSQIPNCQTEPIFICGTCGFWPEL